MQCGTRLQQVLALNPTGAPALTQQLPYNWGKFQGWISLVVGLFALLFAMASLVARAPLDDKAWGYGVLSPLLIATGYAIVRRRRWTAVMTYLWIAVYVGVFAVYIFAAFSNTRLTQYQQGELVGTGLGQLLIGGTFWVFCCLYYRKRRSEFV